MDTFRTVLLIVAIAGGLYLFVSYSRRAARRAELLQPSTTGHIRELSADIGALEREVSGVSSNVSDVQKELGNLDTSVTVIGEELEILRRDAGDVSSDVAAIREDLDGIRSDLAAMRRLLRAIAHQQWTPE
jgi:chromosome segregation ATPase